MMQYLSISNWGQYQDWLEAKDLEEQFKTEKKHKRVMNQLLKKTNPGIKAVLTISNVIALKRFVRALNGFTGNHCVNFIMNPQTDTYTVCRSYIGEYGCSKCDDAFPCVQCGNPVYREGDYCSSYCNYQDNKDLYYQDYNRYF
jgi:hypothetical protein